ncbi:hypothetical protein [Adhaeribacter aquaticus]|uniref:hypothetical protein n=1 Tax=Adhaeribacter aquaticus TaxID=299567 RepID=UPI0003F99330|nr:hypothetical protein [Adhaeribacter aquaticus]
MGKRRIAPKTYFNKKELQRNLIVLFMLSFFISTALIVYLFGMTEGFFSRLFWCMLVIFILSATTVLGIIPLVNKITQKWPR